MASGSDGMTTRDVDQYMRDSGFDQALLMKSIKFGTRMPSFIC